MRQQGLGVYKPVSSPSPVTATTSPCFRSNCTSVNLSVGELLANTCSIPRQSAPNYAATTKGCMHVSCKIA